MSKRKAKTKLPAAPAHLTREAAEIWRAVMGYLSRNGRLEAMDGAAVECYALAVVRQRSLQAEIDRDGVMVGGKAHAALRKVEAAAATVLKYAYLLGLAPGSRRGSAASSPPVAKRNGDVWRGILK